MELIGVIFLLFFLWIAFKILGLIFYTGAFLITLPLKIIGSILLLVLMVPLGIFSLIVAMVGIIIPLLPFVLLIWAIVYLLRDRQSHN